MSECRIPLRQLMVHALCASKVTTADADYLDDAINAYDREQRPFTGKAKRIALETLTREGSRFAADMKARAV